MSLSPMRDEDMKNQFRILLHDTKNGGTSCSPAYGLCAVYFFSIFSTILLPSSKLISKK